MASCLQSNSLQLSTAAAVRACPVAYTDSSSLVLFLSPASNSKFLPAPSRGHFVHGGNTPSKSLNSTLISTSVDWIFDSWGVDHEFEGITPRLVMVKSLRCEHWYQVLVWSQWACNDNKMLDCVLKHNLNEFSLNQFRVITFIEKCFAKYTQCIQYSVCILLFSQTVFHGQYFHYQMPRSLSTWLGWLELN